MMDAAPSNSRAPVVTISPASGREADFGASLREWRATRQLSQAALAARILYSRSLVNLVENGCRRASEAFARAADQALDADGQLYAAWCSAPITTPPQPTSCSARRATSAPQRDSAERLVVRVVILWAILIVDRPEDRGWHTRTGVAAPLRQPKGRPPSARRPVAPPPASVTRRTPPRASADRARQDRAMCSEPSARRSASAIRRHGRPRVVQGAAVLLVPP
ncbi:helix-turn-helix transcriptional regulator [Dactylosporangium sp. NPDC051484]|uniref:helix-turn-helix domain-containing protein n=1 Tax=Dactylosporangium sp. NPDC051484 TaxID=3154942 RepID=UPI00344FAD65